jgi:hypothetical protein
MIVSDHDRLASTAHRAEANGSLVAHALAGYRLRNGFDASAVALWLACEPGSLLSLALCPCPAPASPNFTVDVERLARVAGCDAARLAELLSDRAPESKP